MDFKVVILTVFFWLYWYPDFLFAVWGLTYVTDQRLILVHPNNHSNLRVFLSIWSSNHAEYWRHSRHWQMGVWVTLQVIEYLVLIWNGCLLLFLHCRQSYIQQDFFNNLAFYKVTKAAGKIRCVNLLFFGIKGCRKLSNKQGPGIIRLQDCCSYVTILLQLNTILLNAGLSTI